jgi:hypothetical protein
MLFEKLPLQQGSNVRTHAVENLPLQPGSSHVGARVCMQRGKKNYPAVA